MYYAPSAFVFQISMQVHQWWTNTQFRYSCSVFTYGFWLVLIVHVGSGCPSFWTDSHTFKNKMNIASKARVFRQCFEPTLTYNAHTWAFTKIQVNRLRSTHNKMLHVILGLKLKDVVKIQSGMKASGNSLYLWLGWRDGVTTPTGVVSPWYKNLVVKIVCLLVSSGKAVNENKNIKIGRIIIY